MTGRGQDASKPIQALVLGSLEVETWAKQVAAGGRAFGILVDPRFYLLVCSWHWVVLFSS